MEGSETARRRIGKIAGHFTASDETLSPTHLLPLNCSGSLNSVIRRCDNKLFFARQSSTSQGCFMRQISSGQEAETRCPKPLKCLDSLGEFSLSASEAPLFSRPASTKPAFSRPARMEQNCSHILQDQHQGREFKSSSFDPPRFAKQDKRDGMTFCSENDIYSSESTGGKWLPRMDIAESGSKYVLMIEIPGVNASNVIVEVDEQRLRIMVERNNECWKILDSSDEQISEYHKRQISRGSCQIVWPLPGNVNKDGVSAEILNGLLQVIIPKV